MKTDLDQITAATIKPPNKILPKMKLGSFWKNLEAQLSLEDPGSWAQSGGAGKMSSVWRNQQAVVLGSNCS